MRDADARSFTTFRPILGILIGVALGQCTLAGSEEPASGQAAPISRVEAVASPVSTPEAVAAPLTGPQVYNAVCIACHAPPGVGGAPALGDRGAWAARIAQGRDTLIDHALHGFSGSTGIMPMKGGQLDLSDEEVIRAVEFMIGRVAE